ncbi:hypothetical protein BpHYR1_031300 [Brachionus plicatilis]|uniref:Transmembrane protein n=1 Tax=Brachionus plicatilis TaxID=10195 RepID=A0A3M7T779_BRAPC|nr:hypothetical protein BpHYR1_031300 [Brachionus plicatilis]
MCSFQIENKLYGSFFSKIFYFEIFEKQSPFSFQESLKLIKICVSILYKKFILLSYFYYCFWHVKFEKFVNNFKNLHLAFKSFILSATNLLNLLNIQVDILILIMIFKLPAECIFAVVYQSIL